MSKKLTWRKFHKWGGLLAAVFILIFCFSGIILNHRQFFSYFNVSRSLLPASYSIDKYNNGTVKGTLPLSEDSLLVYGNVGVWLTDSDFKNFRSYNIGFPNGIDYRNIKNMVRIPDGTVWCAAQFGVYRHDGKKWIEVPLEDNDERISDIALTPDSSSLVVLTRSKVYELNPNSYKSTGHTIDAPAGKTPKTTLFKTFWMLHSGELFGIAGRIIVDIVAIIIIFLSLTGIVLFCIPYRLKWRKKNNKGSASKKFLSFFKWNNKWHNKIGYATAILTIIIAFMGMCLRPPLMIPLVLTKTSPIPGSAQDTDNYWHDKMRGIRWDASAGKWLLSTSEGFIRVNPDFSELPSSIENMVTPPVSPMGITVFENIEQNKWIVGSFSGIYLWNIENGSVTDYLTGEKCDPNKRIYGVGSSLVSGMSRDVKDGKPIVFDYAKGAESLPEISDEFRMQPMSLWNTALELHVGRCYTPFLGPFSELFVFTFGLLLTLILISGVIIHSSHRKKE